MRHLSVRLSAQLIFSVVALLCGTSSLCSAQQLKSSATLGFTVRVVAPAALEPSVQLLAATPNGDARVLLSRSLLANRQGQVITRIHQQSSTPVVIRSTSVNELLARPTAGSKNQFELQLPTPSSDSDGAVLEIEFLQL
jgi:hypothetical protein